MLIIFSFYYYYQLDTKKTRKLIIAFSLLTPQQAAIPTQGAQQLMASFNTRQHGYEYNIIDLVFVPQCRIDAWNHHGFQGDFHKNIQTVINC